MPSVTVCIPTYNRAHLLGRAVACALGQTHGNLDVLIYDDASTDGTEKFVSELRDNRIRYYRGSENLKECRSRSVIVDMVTSDYIAWLDSDDLCNRCRVAVQLDVMEKYDVPWSRTDGDALRKDVVPDWKEYPRWKRKEEFLTPSTIVRTDFARKNPYKPYLFGCDTIWELEALSNSKPGIFIPSVLYYYMMHDPGRVSKIYPHRPTFEQEMREQRAYRKKLIDGLSARGIPYRGTTLSRHETDCVVKKCCS